VLEVVIADPLRAELVDTGGLPGTLRTCVAFASRSWWSGAI
jgi:hypothetical protein